ncbi:hypothetical protein HBH64_072970 [Parastagonospora nodorum]|nr:hypothetical protein HBH45_076790 [Parastagonospora nodorum]KAH4167785.1 hypothetical protein HBH44_052650 [Parastagonospora nodorum]KAH4642611.1 hypothetical protein HBH81_076150 [Parastagonospora nodorum]KAH4732899.1 hypothetical protein HBH66_020300 [Parastagonospora nodorum]KAH4751296.1 hypothetical protein HBH64_072970 [Parastagonospora nodorum]
MPVRQIKPIVGLALLTTWEPGGRMDPGADYGLDERESCWEIDETLYAIRPAYCSK